MANIKLELEERNHGAFNIYDSGAKIGEMVIGISNNILSVYHTEVAEEASGKGYAKMLMDNMTAYARNNGLLVRPLCAYVHAQFKKHTNEYADIWLKEI